MDREQIFGMDVIVDEAMAPGTFKIGYPGAYMLRYEDGKIVADVIHAKDFYKPLPERFSRWPYTIGREAVQPKT